MKGLGLAVLTLLAASQSQPAPRRDFNPNPPGVIKDDSSTDRVLRYLRAHRPRFLTHEQIVAGTGCKTKSVSWAVFYLRDLGIIECRRCGDRRSPLYQEYRARPPID